MARLVIVVDVENVPPTLHDPEQIAESVLTDDATVLGDYVQDHLRALPGAPVDFTLVAASWTE